MLPYKYKTTELTDGYECSLLMRHRAARLIVIVRSQQ